VEAHLGRQSARCDVVRAAEGGEEVVEGVFVGDVYASETEAPFVLGTAEEIVLPDRGIEEISVFDTGRIVIVVACARSGNRHELRGKLRRQAYWLAIGEQGIARGCLDSIADQTGLELFVGR